MAKINGNGNLIKVVLVILGILSLSGGIFLTLTDRIGENKACADGNTVRIKHHDERLDLQKKEIKENEETGKKMLTVLHHIDVNQNVVMYKMGLEPVKPDSE